MEFRTELSATLLVLLILCRVEFLALIDLDLIEFRLANAFNAFFALASGLTLVGKGLAHP